MNARPFLGNDVSGFADIRNWSEQDFIFLKQEVRNILSRKHWAARKNVYFSTKGGWSFWVEGWGNQYFPNMLPAASDISIVSVNAIK